MESLTLSSSVAFIFGVLHALEPGHGKTALLTYVASGKRTWREGIVISVTSAFTHSLAVFIIAFVSHYILHQTNTEGSISFIGEFLGYISGALICALGIWIIYKNQKGIEKKPCSTCSGEHHHHEHYQGEDTKVLTKGKVLTSTLLGIATGMIPCPTIVVAYLSGISTGGSLLGIQSVLLFAIGMCFSLMGVVTFCSFSGEKIVRKLGKSKFPMRWDLIQGSVFIVIGLVTAFYH